MFRNGQGTSLHHDVADLRSPGSLCSARTQEKNLVRIVQCSSEGVVTQEHAACGAVRRVGAVMLCLHACCRSSVAWASGAGAHTTWSMWDPGQEYVREDRGEADGRPQAQQAVDRGQFTPARRARRRQWQKVCATILSSMCQLITPLVVLRHVLYTTAKSTLT